MEHDHEGRLRELEKAIWQGNGKPGLKSRIEIMELIVGKISNNLTWIVRLLIAILIGMVVKLYKG